MKKIKMNHIKIGSKIYLKRLLIGKFLWFLISEVDVDVINAPLVDDPSTIAE